MLLSKALQEKTMDVRLQDKLLAEGKLTKEQIKKFLGGLPDDTKNMTTTEGHKEKAQ
jgi:polyhydroxyalkanoate synthesis regulator phasin